MNRTMIGWACTAIGAGIGLGAFGAHGLRRLTRDEDLLRGYQTAIDYHLFHSLAFLLLGIWGSELTKSSANKFSLRVILWGVMIFSGSLYLMTLFRLSGWDHAWVGPITPVGGGLLIAGWAWLGYSLLRPERPN